ncbi:MAG: hypothetical protein Q8L60_06230 [Gammaproteobacteria bacterium]|nr:hypothetical protein [Gammaproteobacteria bacterium]MDP2141699.1 hypothetical protein [Gammaproteobacteria bacterium]MDP2347934.1 hypothetical protein [Gammaproteobacteria bacterium]
MTREFEYGGGSVCEMLQGQCQDVLMCRDVIQDGKTVRIEVEFSGDDGWILRIIGRNGQVSEWTELFSSSGEAMTTALSAIRYEGIDDFYDDPIFHYLQERHSH